MSFNDLPGSRNVTRMGRQYRNVPGSGKLYPTQYRFTLYRAPAGMVLPPELPRVVWQYGGPGGLGHPTSLKLVELDNMKFASAHYVAEPTIEMYIFVDEKPSDLPENASLIIETTDQNELLSAVEPYFILGSGK